MPSLDTVGQIAQAITPFLGEATGKILFGLGMAGSALVATIVVTLTAARTLGEVLGVKHSLRALRARSTVVLRDLHDRARLRAGSSSLPA